MTTITLRVVGAEVKASVTGPLTGGMVGLPVTIHYDEGWDGLVKTLVCRSSANSRGCDVIRTVVNPDKKTTVAHEVMVAGRTLYLGIEGRAPDGTEVYPTIWADCGKIQPGANADGDPTTEATQAVWEQILTQMGSLDGLNTDSKETLVSAINEAMTKGNGLPGKDGCGITAVTGNENGSWTVHYEDGREETVSNEAYLAMGERMDQLAVEIAGKEQLAPEFANSIEECTDTSKLYVLPDGYIYAYMACVEYPFTNQIPQSINSDGTDFVGENGEDGYKTGYRLNSSGAEDTDTPSAAVTGFIPVGDGDTVYLKNVKYKAGETGLGGSFGIYNSNFGNIITVLQANNFSDYGYLVSNYTVDDEGYLTSVTLYDKYSNGISYVRVSAIGLNNASIITVNEEITDEGETTYAWKNTGRAFVPTDYEDRIIPLEEASEDHESRLKTLELWGVDSVSNAEIPAYIQSEATDVMERLINTQGNRSFNLIAMSDFHYGGMGDNKDNLIRACKAVAYITGRIHIDAVATLGDNIPHGTTTESAWESGNRWFKEINEILKMTEGAGIAMFRTPGNHDRMGGNDESGNPTTPIPDNAIFQYISGYNRQGQIGDVPGGWCYQDFAGHKLRVIVLNTAECEGQGRFSEYSGYRMSTKQYNWLINTLDLGHKEDAADWQILILSHHRPDDWQAYITETEWGENGYILPNILHAYQTGGSFSGTKEDGDVISCDFSGKNQAALIGCIHGHRHDYTYGPLYLGTSSNSDQCDVLAIGTPSLGFSTAADNNADNDGNGYPNVKDTAEETAFCLYSIDLDNRKVLAIHYGAGIDREIAYS